MKKKVDVTFVVSCLLFLIPLIISAVFYRQLPDQVAIHFDNNGTPNGYAPRLFAAFGIPLVLFAIHVITQVTMANDPKKANTPQVFYSIFRWFIPVLAVILQGATIFYVIGKPFNMSVISVAVLGIVLIGIGNYLPKCKQNYTVGIKLPWTLNDEEIWNKTHRLAGFVWVIGGIVFIAAAFLQIVWIEVALVAVIFITPTVYSFVLYHKRKPK